MGGSASSSAISCQTRTPEQVSTLRPDAGRLRRASTVQPICTTLGLVVTSNTRFCGAGPKEAQGTTDALPRPRLDQLHTPLGKIVFSRARSALVKSGYSVGCTGLS